MPSQKSDSKGIKKKKPTAPKKAVVKPSQESNLSTEFIQESDEEADDSAEEGLESDINSSTKASALSKDKANGKIQTQSVAYGSSEESGSESESGSGSDEESSSGSDNSETGSESGSESEGEEEATEADTKRPVVEESARPSKKNQADKVVTFVSPAPFKPPPGFELQSVDDDGGSSMLFKKSNLEGKEIWYITAPASVPITSVEKIAVQDMLNGKRILSHEGSEYGFVEDTVVDKTYMSFLVPNSSDNAYKARSQAVNKIFHLQRQVQIPGTSTSASSSSRATVPAAKPIRQQPEGMRLRFQPIGMADADSGFIVPRSISDEEMTESPRKQGSKKSSNRTRSSDSDVEMSEAPPLKKSKKAKSHSTKSSEKSSRRKHEGADNVKEKKSLSLLRKHGGTS